MKPWYWLLGAVLAFLAALAFLPSVDATANCGLPVADRCHGESMTATTTGGVASGRCFFFTTSSTAPACSTAGIGTTTNRAAWALTPGSCVTLYYHDVTNGAVPPAAPNKVTLRVDVDTSVTVTKTYQASAAEPASGTSYTFCATSNGDVGGTPRAGTWYLDLVAVKDNGPGGVGNYAVSAAGTGSPSSFDAGGLRGSTTVSSVSRSAYPAGSTFAYGSSADESIAVTTTFTQPNGDNNVETSFNSILDASTLLVGQAGATVDVDATTTLAQSFVADNTFPQGNSPYVPGWTIAGNSVLLGEKWSILSPSGHGGGLTRFSDTFIYDGSFNIDSRIRMDSEASGGFASADETDKSYVGGSCTGAEVDLFNRGELACTSWALVNARDEYLSRSMTHFRRDASNNVCSSYGSLTPSSNIYTASGTFNTGGSCAAAADTTGSTRHLLVTNTDQSYLSGTIYRISSLYHVDSHLQLASTLAPDDYPTDDANEILAYEVRGDGMGGDLSETTRQWCFVDGVRHDAPIDTSGSAITRTIKDPTATTRATGTTDTASDGWTATSQNLLASTPLGDDWTALCSVAFNGNTGSDTEIYEVFVNTTGGGETVYTGADPLTIFAHQTANGTVPIAIHSRLLDGTARTGAAATIFVSVFDWPSMSPVVTGANVTEVDATNAPGAYAYAFTAPYAGAFLVSANTTDGANPIGAHNVVTVEATNTLELSTMSNFEGLGFDGFLFVLFWIAAALFFIYRDWVFSLAFTVPGLLDALFPAQIPGEFAQYLLLAFVGVVAQYFAGDRGPSIRRKTKSGA